MVDVDRNKPTVAFNKMDMTVEPYAVVKEFLDKRARETMYEIEDIINKALSFEQDKKDNKNE